MHTFIEDAVIYALAVVISVALSIAGSVGVLTTSMPEE
jgi:hypothetical protein